MLSIQIQLIGLIPVPPPAEALDAWFENLQNYEVTLVCRLRPSQALLVLNFNRKRWLPPLLMSTSKRN